MAVIQGVYVLNRDNPLTSQTVTFPFAFSNNWTTGSSMRISWKDLEPTEGVFNWSIFDQDLAAAKVANKRVIMRIYTVTNSGTLPPPTWALSSGIQFFYVTSSGSGSGLTVSLTQSGGAITGASIVNPGSGYSSGTRYVLCQVGSGVNGVLQISVNSSGVPTAISSVKVGGHGYTTATATTVLVEPVPVPWDATFQSKWQAAITAFAGKYANDSAVDAIQMAGLDITGGEMHLTGANDTLDASNWAAAPYNYTPTLLINAWKAIIDMYIAAFPDKHLGLNLSTPISSTVGSVVQTVSDYAFATCAYGHLMLQHNALAAKTSVGGNPQLWVDRGQGQNALIGYQELCDATSAAGGDRWRGNTAGTPATLAQFQAGMAIGAAYAQGPGLYVEAYPGNVGTYNTAGYSPYFSSYTGPLLLENFTGNAFRTTKDGTEPLWSAYTSEGAIETCTLDTTNHQLVLTITGRTAGTGAYWQFFPRGDNDKYSFPNGFAQTYIQSGVFRSNTNRLTFKMLCNKTIPTPSVGETFEFGNYVKGHTFSDTSQQGQHFYWISALGTVLNEVMYVYLDSQVQHEVGQSGGFATGENIPYDPSWNANDSFEPIPTRFMDALTRWYCSDQTTTVPAIFNQTNVFFDTVDESSEPIALIQGTKDPTPRNFKLVSTVTVTYNSSTSTYQLVWAGPANISQNYRVAYKTSSMKSVGGGATGWNSGTWDGTTVTNLGSDYQLVYWTSPVLPRGNYWFGIKPVSNNTRGYFTEVSYQSTGTSAPIITSASSTSFTVSQSGSFQVTASGVPTPTFSETGSLPSGVTFNSAGLLSGTPGGGTAGTYPIVITATNGVNPNATQNFTLTVNGTAPTITSTNHTTFKIGTAGSFQMTATGTTPITWSKTGSLPSGVTLNSAGLLAGTPAAATSGNYTITVTATNGIAPDATQVFTLTVQGLAPAITSANTVTFQTGVAGSFTVKATGDPTPTFTESGALPSGVTFNTTTGVLSGTPGAGTGGSRSITFGATNGVSPDASQPFTLIVNQAPAITSSNSTTFTVGTPGTFSVTATGYPAPTFSKTAGTLPSGVTLSNSGTLAGTPAAGTGGTYSITISASNGVSPTATQSFTLTVDQAPSITSANAASFVELQAGTFTVTASGFPAPTFSKTGSLPSGVTLVSNGVLSGTPAAASAGSYPIVITATNGVNPDATQNFTLTVVAATVAPTITSANNTAFTVGLPGSFQATATGTQPITWTITAGSLPSGVTFSSGGLLSGTPATATGGSYPLTIQAANGTLPNATQSFTLTVHTPPTITSANATTFTEGTAGSFQVTATGDAVITFSKTGSLPSGVTLNSAGLLAGTPAGSTAGSYPITITATNGVSPDATQAFTLTVQVALVAPSITSANTTTFTAQTGNLFTVTATGTPAPTFSQTGSLPSGVTLSSAGALSGTPISGTGGSYVITLTAANGTLPNATQTFTLVVNESPTFTSAAQATFSSGIAGSFTVTVDGSPASTLSISGTLPSGITFNAITGVLSGTAADGTAGTYSLTFGATNSVSPDASQDFTLQIIGTAPVFISLNSATFVKNRTGQSFTVIATGIPTPTYTSAGSLPTGMTIDGVTGIINGTPTKNGTFLSTITATNSSGTSTQKLTLNVNNGRGIGLKA